MFKMWQRYLQHKAAMDILDLAFNMFRQKMYTKSKNNVKDHLKEMEEYALGLVKIHANVLKEIKMDTAKGITEEEVTTLKRLFVDK